MMQKNKLHFYSMKHNGNRKTMNLKDNTAVNTKT